ncbi:MAG TPA: FtsW/RodA/SpoVE family cell cycle protein [Ruminiclostridium sp.]|nr:FtsW/RodA/SpoVE family cell cycle protein [Ruminiclostridium sp.]
MINSVLSSVRLYMTSGALSDIFKGFALNFSSTAIQIYTLLVRWVMPVLAIIIVVRCILPLLANRGKNIPWGYLVMSNGTQIPLLHWENSVGRSRLSDVVLNFPFISRSHAVITLSEDGWVIADLDSKGGVQVNGEDISEPTILEQGDVISLSGLELTLLNADLSRNSKSGFDRFSERMSSGPTLFLIIVFQILGALQLCLSMNNIPPVVPISFSLFFLAECVHYFVNRVLKAGAFQLELLAYFLCGIGLFAITSRSPASLIKQVIAIYIGIGAYSLLLYLIRNLERAQKVKYFIMAAAVLLLLLNIVLGQMRNGARNWIDIGFITIQPMEFVKIAFVLAGAATLDRLLTTRNLTSFIVFSGACIGTLAITKDFGTALVFFCSFVVIAFMRSGDLRTIALICAGAFLGAVAVASFMPYVTSRFSAWGHVWNYANSTGYQQTRTMVAAASGGLLGVGGGKGYLVNIAASDTDLVFGVICEEWGFIIALAAVLAILFLVFYSVFSVKNCRSSFYSISACGVAAIFLMQTALNVFGSVDILPLTGVTLPFVSNGGSSVVTCWCLLAFIKSERFVPKKAV